MGARWAARAEGFTARSAPLALVAKQAVATPRSQDSYARSSDPAPRAMKSAHNRPPGADDFYHLPGEDVTERGLE